MKRLIILIEISLLLSNYVLAQKMDDPYLWLEEVKSKPALKWVVTQNNRSLAELQKYSDFDTIYNKNLEINSSEQGIGQLSLQNRYFYTVKQDDQHERGIWQRTSMASYINSKPLWEKLLDIDSLSEADSENWYFRGAEFATPTSSRCIISFTRGGGERIGREFDVQQKAFVKNGFHIPAGTGVYSWRDENSLYLTMPFNEERLEKSRYRHIVKAWKRGTKLEDAEIVFKDSTNAYGAFTVIDHRPERSYHIIVQSLDAGKSNFFVLEQRDFIRLELPNDAFFRFIQGQIVVYLQSDWGVGHQTFQGGSIVAIDYDDFLKGNRNFSVIFQSNVRSHFWFMSCTKSYLLVNMLSNACPEVYQFRFEHGNWSSKRIPAPDLSSTYISLSKCSVLSDSFFISYTNFLEPSTTCLVREDGTINRIERDPAFFDPDPFVAHQYQALSKDNTPIPYFIVHPRDMVLDGANPTVLTGYGTFGESLTPDYKPVMGSAWLENGGVYVLASIRGGGEFGPKWHRAAQGKNRQRSFDDFIAVAEDLIARGITSPKHLGIMGHSGGGLLVGAVVVQRPNLFNAIACLNPVLDMKREFITKDEYGDPDNPDDWNYMKKYSPYHNVSPDSIYPRILFVTSRTDRRVPPWHARKMAAKMEDMGHEVFFYEAEEGGHGSAITPSQKAYRDALIYSYLWKQLR
jgi:prolyl oligopeptidase